MRQVVARDNQVPQRMRLPRRGEESATLRLRPGDDAHDASSRFEFEQILHEQRVLLVIVKGESDAAVGPRMRVEGCDAGEAVLSHLQVSAAYKRSTEYERPARGLLEIVGTLGKQHP